MHLISASFLRSLRILLSGFAQVFLQQHPGCGLLVLLALLIGAPELIPGALLGGLASQLTARLRGCPEADLNIGLYGYNGVLLGLLLSLKLPATPLLALLIVLLAGLSSLLLMPWMQRMRQRGWPPAFTLPYVTLSWLALALYAPATPAIALPAPVDMDALQALLAILRGVAQVVFLDSAAAGFCLLLALMLADWRAALWAVLGSSVGLVLALLLVGSTADTLAGIYGYNPVLAAIALAQVHRSPLLPVLGILLAVLLQPIFPAMGMLPLSMPFILACWLVRAGTQSWQRALHSCDR